MTDVSVNALEQRARRAAKRVGLMATKSRRGIDIDNHGEFMVFDPMTNFCVAGPRFDMTAEDVLEYCADDDESVTTTKTTGE